MVVDNWQLEGAVEKGEIDGYWSGYIQDRHKEIKELKAQVYTVHLAARDANKALQEDRAGLSAMVTALTDNEASLEELIKVLQDQAENRNAQIRHLTMKVDGLKKQLQMIAEHTEVSVDELVAEIKRQSKKDNNE